MANLTLSIIMATMATISTAMLGMGQGSFLLPTLTLLAATASVVFTDARGWFYLNRVVANLAMLAAAVFSLWGFLETDSRQQLFAIAHLLVYVQLVLLFQAKNRRVYGQIAMFSLLQVVVAALLNNRLEFGVMLACYMLVAMLGFVVFFVYREVGRVGTLPPHRRWWQLLNPSAPSHDVPPDNIVSVEVADHGPTLNRTLMTRQILAPVLTMFVVSVVLAIVLFYTTPRTGEANWRGGGGVINTVGFSPEISFEDMGKLLLDDSRVMRVSFADVRDGSPYTVIGKPYFRGGVLNRYLTTGGDGGWRQESEPGSTSVLPLTSPPDTRDLVRQEVLLEPTGSNRLFSMFPAYAIAQTPPNLRLHSRTNKLFRLDASERETRDEYRYSLATTAFRFGAQITVTPYHPSPSTEQDQRGLNRTIGWLRHLGDRDAFPELIALAEQVVQDKAPGGNTYERAKALEAYFADSPRYYYSLDLDAVNARRRFDVDPIEDFVSNHRTGHCEYFASALTLALRSQGIPARMIVGYHGGEFNHIGNYFVVRQRNAHAWVEAYLSADEIPEGLMYPEEQHAGGGWLRLDPTPSEESENPLSEMNLLDRANKSLDYARWLWNDYVMRLTEERRKNAILAPLAYEPHYSLAGLVRTKAWQSWAERLTGSSLSRWKQVSFSWRRGLLATCACLGVFIVYRSIRTRSLLSRRLRPRRRRGDDRDARARVAFYLRLESVLARVGLHRDPTQTQRQFARDAARALASSPPYALLASIPDQIVERFYQVRFGHQTPDASAELEIDQQLQALEQTLPK